MRGSQTAGAEPGAATAGVLSSRIVAIDIARGVALVAMTVYHFAWDLAAFGIVDAAFPHSVEMIWFARAIAGSFLFLVGVSLVLAHGNGIRWNGFWKRMAMIIAAAALITLVTYFATPDAFIFFGILHSIALASIFGLAFLFAPWWTNAAAAAFFLLAGPGLVSPDFDAPFWWWTGLSERVIVSNDYVPIFPFFGMVLAGMAAAQVAAKYALFERLEKWHANGKASLCLLFIGRHSLAYYLLHQPVLIALLATVLWAAGRL